MFEANNPAAASPPEREFDLGELQSALFDAAGEGILVMDAASTRILGANRRAGEIHGYGPSEMVGLLARDLLPDPPDPDVTRKIRDTLAGRGFHETDSAVHRRKDGSLFICGVNLRQITVKGRPYQIGFYRDLTAQLKTKEDLLASHDAMERQVQERTAELVRTRDALQAEIAERKVSEESLRQSEARLKMLITQLPAILWTTDTELRFTSLMGAGLNSLTIRPEHVMGKTMADIMGAGDEGVRTVECHRQALEGKPASYVILVKDLFFNSHVEPLRNAQGAIIGVIGASLNDTGRMRAERAVRESEERHRRILEKAPIAIGISQGELVQYVNPEWLRLFGYPRADEVVGASLYTHLAPESRDVFRAWMQRRENGESLRSGIELVGLRKNGSRFDYHVEYCQIPMPNGDSTVTMGIDITARRRAEEALRQGHEDLERKVAERTRELAGAVEETRVAYQNLKVTQEQLIRSEKLVSIGMLVSGVAHEINNPLNVIMGNLKLLTQKDRLSRICNPGTAWKGSTPQESQRIRGMLRDATRAAERACVIIETFRSFARDSRSGEDVDLNECILQSTQIVKRELPSRVAIVHRLGRIPRVPCFRGQINQVLLNLIKNAGEAIVGKGRIIVKSKEEKGRVIVEIIDTGRGMPLETQARVFDPFFTTKPVGQGLGLGLSISAMIVQNHGGNLSVKSQEGKGTTFRIELPLSREE